MKSEFEKALDKSIKNHGGHKATIKYLKKIAKQLKSKPRIGDR